MPIVLETTPEFTPPGAQSPVCVCVRSRHTQRSMKLVMVMDCPCLLVGFCTHNGQRSSSWLASCCEQTEGEIRTGSPVMPTWPPPDWNRPKGKWPPSQVKRPQAQGKRLVALVHLIPVITGK
jgi:hypothetical protein